MLCRYDWENVSLSNPQAEIKIYRSNVFGVPCLEAGFKEQVAVLELPLLGCLFAGLKEGETFGGWVGRAQRLSRAGCIDAGEIVRLLPKAGTGQEAVLERGASHLREVDAGDAFVVGRESHGNACSTIGG